MNNTAQQNQQRKETFCSSVKKSGTGTCKSCDDRYGSSLMSDDAEPDAVEASMLDDSDSDVSCGFSTVGVDEAAFSGIGEVVAGGAEEG